MEVNVVVTDCHDFHLPGIFYISHAEKALKQSQLKGFGLKMAVQAFKEMPVQH